MRLRYDGIRIGPPQDRVQLQRNSGVVRYIDLFRDLIDVEERDDALSPWIERATRPIRNRHHNQSGLLLWTDIVKLYPLLHIFARLEPE